MVFTIEPGVYASDLAWNRGQVFHVPDHDVHTPIEPGMVFTIEPGVYASDLGGFRHSDTVVVTENGIEILTDYPRDLESLTIPA